MKLQIGNSYTIIKYVLQYNDNCKKKKKKMFGLGAQNQIVAQSIALLFQN